jgi:hypothetical protein
MQNRTNKVTIRRSLNSQLFPGYEIFVLQNGGWCGSSANAGDTYKKYGAANNCAADGEGGEMANQVYRIKTSWKGLSTLYTQMPIEYRLQIFIHYGIPNI